jgi:hypothetical protein
MKTKTLFRKFHEGDIIALFPEIPGNSNAQTCMSYQTIGQHGSASVDLSHCTQPAKPEEYAELLAELVKIGYDVEICTRRTLKNDRARIAELNRAFA